MNTFDEIIQTKAYSDLTSDELEVIRELVSTEQEYNEMKSFYAGIDQLAISHIAEVSPSVKTSLNSVFQAKHPGISQNWSAPAETEEKKSIPLYNRTIFRVAALLVLTAGVTTVWFSMSDNQSAEKEEIQLAENTDSVSSELKKETSSKKKFPLNEESKKFTAASNIPKDENVEDALPVYSNATTGSSLPDEAEYDQTLKKSGSSTYKIQISDEARTTFYFSNPKPAQQKNMREKAKKEEKAPEPERPDTYAKAGLDADLNPGGFYGNSVNRESTIDYKPSISTNDLLSLIEPSF
jgi:hypothetical protein